MSPDGTESVMVTVPSKWFRDVIVILAVALDPAFTVIGVEAMIV